MKTFFSICVLAIIVGASDLNPLLMWKPYHAWINNVISSFPQLFFGVILLALIVGACISADEPRKPAHH